MQVENKRWDWDVLSKQISLSVWIFLIISLSKIQTHLALVRSHVCVKLFAMNWTSAQAVVKGWASWPAVLEVKKHADCKLKWRSSAWWRGKTCISATTTDISQHVISPSLHLIPPFPFLHSLFFYPVRHNKLTCPWSEAKDITLCHIILSVWRQLRMCL